MKNKPPIKLWACNRADGKTTLGQYVNAKRKVTYTLEPGDLHTIYELVNDWLWSEQKYNTKIVMAGDIWPDYIVNALRKNGINPERAE